MVYNKKRENREQFRRQTESKNVICSKIWMILCVSNMWWRVEIWNFLLGLSNHISPKISLQKEWISASEEPNTKTEILPIYLHCTFL